MRNSQKKRMTRIAALSGVVLLVAAACSSDSEDLAPVADRYGAENTTYVTTTIAATSDFLTEASGDDATLGTGGVAVPTVYRAIDYGRDIIFVADLTVAVTDVAAAGEEATRAIQGLGGFLFAQRTTGSPEPYSVLTFKVLPEDFQEALDRLGSIGEIRTQNVAADDVTDRIVDLESRISTAAASVDRLRTLLEEATDIATIVELENELLARETQLETLRGQLRTLQDQVSLATIVLTLTEAAVRPAIALQTTAYPGHDSGAACPGGPDLTVDEGAAATLCFEITNTGDTGLAGFTLRDPVLGIELDDLVVVFGDPAGPIEPGQSMMLAAQLAIERNLRTQTTVTATPVDTDGNPLPGRTAAKTGTMYLGAADPGGIPSFSDGLAASWNLLVEMGQWFVLFVGGLLPFLWILPLGWWLWRRRTHPAIPAAPSGAMVPPAGG